jgi:hypothetical protein
MNQTKGRSLGVAAAAFLVSAGLTFVAVPGALASAGHPSPGGQVIDIGPSPVGLPGNCPFPNNDANFLVTSGHAVAHDTSNNNGDWGGLTFTGTATLRETPYSGFDSNNNPIDTGAPVPLYSGHLTYWTGGGNNANGQNEGGATVNFSGTSLTGPAMVTIHVNFHGTMSSSGMMAGNPQNVSVTCS